MDSEITAEKLSSIEVKIITSTFRCASVIIVILLKIQDQNARLMPQSTEPKCHQQLPLLFAAVLDKNF